MLVELQASALVPFNSGRFKPERVQIRDATGGVDDQISMDRRCPSVSRADTYDISFIGLLDGFH